MDNLTRKGLFILILGLILQIVSTLCLFVADMVTLQGFFVFVLAVIIGMGGGIFSLIGVIVVILGRKEFGEQHSKYAIGALLIFIASYVVSFLFSIINVMLQYSSTSTSELSTNAFQMALSTVLGGLMYVFLLYELEDTKGKIVLGAAFFSILITSVFIAMQTISIYEEILDPASLENPSLNSIFSSFSGLFKVGIYGVIGNALLLIALYLPYRRIKSGELIPVAITSNAFFDFSKTDTARRCPNCARIIPFNANVCPYCGRKFES